MTVRKAFDIAAKGLAVPAHPPLAGVPLQIGERVLCRGQLAELLDISVEGKCAVLFSVDGHSQRVDYDRPFGKSKGSARLQRPPPSLAPSSRETRKDAVSAELLALVHEVYESNCPESPHQRDGMKRQLGRHVVESRCARIRMQTFSELYATFKMAHPNSSLSESAFKRLAPWNLKKAYRETCLCRCCELFKLFLSALNTVAEVLSPLLTSAAIDEEDSAESNGEDESEPRAKAALQKLINFCGHQHKTQMAVDLVCGDCIETAKPECIKGDCHTCGFKALWKPVRESLIDEEGQLRTGVPPAWQNVIRYEILKSGGSLPSDGSASDERESLRERRESSVLELLDLFEKASVKYPEHRHLVVASKSAARERDRNHWMGMLLSDYDWSENGVIGSARQIQSEYWSLTYYSLFIQITSHLKREEWLDRRSLLPIGSEVTVQDEGDDFGSDKPTKGAFYAMVVDAPDKEGEHELYAVKVLGHPTLADGSVIAAIKRERLRHRQKFTTATIGVTDEKRHDSHTTQHFLEKQFQHWLLSVDREQYWAWVGHSDNASHFKSGAMINYWSGKTSELEFLKMCWIDFGCPGHGKGPWDGLGAVLKQQVTRDITNNKVLTESGAITCPAEVAEHLRSRFSTAEWRDAHKDKHIHEIVVFYSPHQDIHRPRGDNNFDSLDGAKSSFSYMMLTKDQVARRERSCWCMGCMRAEGRINMQSMGDKLVCAECTHRDKPIWTQQTIRNLGSGLAGRRKEAQDEGKKLAMMLKAPTDREPHNGFIAIQVSTADFCIFLIGGPCVLVVTCAFVYCVAGTRSLVDIGGGSLSSWPLLVGSSSYHFGGEED